MGSALMGSLRISCFLTEGLFGLLPLAYFYLPKVPGRTFFPNLSKFITFAAAPLVLTTFVRNQVLCPVELRSLTSQPRGPLLPSSRLTAFSDAPCDSFRPPSQPRYASITSFGPSVGGPSAAGAGK